MHIILHLSLIIITTAVIANCKGGRGGRGGSRGIRTSGSGGSPCTTDACKNSLIAVFSSIGGLFAAIGIIFGTIYCYRQFKRRSSWSNAGRTTSIPLEKTQTDEKDNFQTGIWTSRYYQYNQWHGPYQFSLSFDSLTSNVNGKGTDDVGTFTIEGKFWPTTRRIELTKIYQQNTGNPLENFGHKVMITVTWNATRDQFEGKWFVQTSNYRREDKFELKFVKDTEILIDRTKF